MEEARKKLKRDVEEVGLHLQPGQRLVECLLFPEPHLVEVMDDKGVISLAFFPWELGKCHKIETRTIVVVNGCSKKTDDRSGREVAYVVLRVLDHEQLSALQKSPSWEHVIKQDLDYMNCDPQNSDHQPKELRLINDEDGILNGEVKANNLRANAHDSEVIIDKMRGAELQLHEDKRKGKVFQSVDNESISAKLLLVKKSLNDIVKTLVKFRTRMGGEGTEGRILKAPATNIVQFDIFTMNLSRKQIKATRENEIGLVESKALSSGYGRRDHENCNPALRERFQPTAVEALQDYPVCAYDKAHKKSGWSKAMKMEQNTDSNRLCNGCGKRGVGHDRRNCPALAERASIIPTEGTIYNKEEAYAIHVNCEGSSRQENENDKKATEQILDHNRLCKGCGNRGVGHDKCNCPELNIRVQPTGCCLFESSQAYTAHVNHERFSTEDVGKQEEVIAHTAKKNRLCKGCGNRGVGHDKRNCPVLQERNLSLNTKSCKDVAELFPDHFRPGCDAL